MKLTARIAAAFNRSGAARDHVAGAAAMPAVSGDANGTGAPSSRRTPVALIAVVAMIAGLALTAAPALAAPTVTTPVVSDVSYTTAHVTSEVNPQGTGFFSYVVQVSTNGTDWANNAAGFFFQKETINANLSGLDDGTQYFVRLAANSGFGVPDPPEVISPAPNPSFTTLTASPPTIPGAVVATDVFSTSATGSAEVNRPVNSDNVTCHFEYVSDAEFTATGFAGATERQCTENPIEEAGTKTVSAPLGCTAPVAEPGNCLAPATTYHLRLVAENAGGTVTKDAASTFTTLPAVAKPTVLATDDATSVNKRSAKASGEIERPAGADPALDVHCRFEFVTEAQFTANGFAEAGQAPCAENPVTSPAPGYPAVEAGVTGEPSGLEPDTTYHLRLAAENGGGVDTKEAVATFHTVALIHPTITIDSITEIGYVRARVNITVDPGNQGFVWYNHFSPVGKEEWSGSADHYVPAGQGPTPISFYSDIGFASVKLKPGTDYQIKIDGYDYEEFCNSCYSAIAEFTTLGTKTPPEVILDPVSPVTVTATTAHFSGTVDAKGPAGPLSEEGKAAYRTDWHFECTPECPPNADLSGVVEAEEGSVPISVDATRLEPNLSYKVKLVAHNSRDTVESLRTFKTPLIPPSAKSTPGGSDGRGGYILQGVVNPNNSMVTSCEFEWGPTAPDYAFSAPCSPSPGDKGKPVTVEAHLTGLTPGAVYHARLVATNAGGTSTTGDQTFIPTLDSPESCPENEQERKENSSLALPECRAYEMVSPPGKEGYGAGFVNFSGSDRVLYESGAGNLARSGQNANGQNFYVTTRTPAGWETIPNLNGSSGSIYDAPSEVDSRLPRPEAYSADLLSSLWNLHQRGGPGDPADRGGLELPYLPYLRSPDGSFTWIASRPLRIPNGGGALSGASDDLSHIFFSSIFYGPTPWGPGVYEFEGVENEQPPRRADVDNADSPISTCSFFANPGPLNAYARTNSSDGRVFVFKVAGGCGGSNPPANELWARIGGTTSIEISASQCDRSAADPGGLCNEPVGSGGCNVGGIGDESGPGCRGARFQGAAKDGSRVFFTTKRQLLDKDVDQSNDLYACDIPAGIPAPVQPANPCASLRQVSAPESGAAEVEEFFTTSDDGSTAYFTATGVLADNEGAFKEQAVAGGHNLYVWRTDAAHPDGQIAFIGLLNSNDVDPFNFNPPQTTSDGRYLVLTTASPLVDTDTDTARDVYRYDADTGQLTRVSTNVSGVGGNGDGFDAKISGTKPQPNSTAESSAKRHLTGTVSDDGQKVVFTTTEALSPADGNAEPDVYLWTPARVSLISTGSVGGGGISPVMDGSGQNIYFETPGALTPADGDDAVDVYDARVGGGFSFAPTPICAGEKCQPDATPAPPKKAPLSAQPGSGNPPPPRPCPKGKVRKKNGKCVKKPCPKGKVRKHGKCVKKPSKKHHAKKGKRTASHNRGGNASHNRGGNK